jgi:hypothetical protein
VDGHSGADYGRTTRNTARSDSNGRTHTPERVETGRRADGGLGLVTSLAGCTETGKTTITDFFEEPLEIENPCNGEFVTVTGTVHYVAHENQAENGRMNQNLKIQVTGTGTGEKTGAEYRFNRKEQLQFHGDSDDDAEVRKEQLTTRLIGKGQTPNFLATTYFHVTIHPNGDVTGEVKKIESKCPSQGPGPG